MADNPFVPGARVAVYLDRYGGNGGMTEDYILKAHKNGNFTLRSDPKQQWRGYSDGTAIETGSGYGRRSLTIWNDQTDAKIRERIAFAKRSARLAALRHQVEYLKPGDITDAQLDAIEAALPVRK